jgi:major type 1 subunit fimbrin (pilin)
MNKTLLSAALIAGFGIAALAPQNAQAAVDGTITVTGLVVAQTCTVDAQASGGNADLKTVALPLVLAPALTAVGSTAGTTAFSIVVANCDKALSTVQTSFSGGNINAGDGNLTNPAGATNVEVQLLNSSGTVMTLNGATPTLQNSPVVALAGVASKGATLNYSARYYSLGGATAGAVSSTVAFTMVYQ